MKKIAILGSTGSIGKQTLEVVRKNKNLKVVAIVGYNNIELLKEQAKEFNCEYIGILGLNNADLSLGQNWHFGDCLKDISKLNIDIVVVALRGIISLQCVTECIKNNIDIAIANKETLVTAGELITEMLKSSTSKLFPIDSEHYAIKQCLTSGKKKEVERLILTASGGALYDLSLEQLKNAKAIDALKHPNWQMGEKITIDSATLMNKGLEIIEAKWLFNIDAKNIDVVIHRESIVHSMVEFKDGSVIAQLAVADMKLPICGALLNSKTKCFQKLNLFDKAITFSKPDLVRFPCLKLAMNVEKMNKIAPTVMVAANDVLVSAYLKNIIGFYDIPKYINYVLNNYLSQFDNIISVDNIFYVDNITRQILIEVLKTDGIIAL